MRSVLLVLALSACSAEGAVEIVVTAPDGVTVDTVELYIGINGGETELIRPAAGTLAPAVWWKRDHKTRYVEPFVDGRAQYQFQRGGRSDALAAFVAVGYAGDTPVGVAARLLWTDIPDGERHIYSFDLAPFTALPRDNTSPPTPGMPGLQVWGPSSDPRACVQVDNVPDLAAYGNPSSAMIVSNDDIDCDGYLTSDPTMECEPNEHVSQTAMTRDSLQCALPVQLATPANPAVEACVAGGGACTDGSGMTDCAPSGYCAPTQTCTECNGELDCDPLQVAGLRVICEFPAAFSDATQQLEMCSESRQYAVLRGLFAGIACDTSKGAKMRVSGGPFTTQLQYPDGPKFAITEATQECVIGFQAFGSPVSSNGTIAERYVALLTLPLLTGRGLALPVVFRPSTQQYTSCPPPGETTCAIEGTAFEDAGLRACVAAPVPPEQIVVD